MCDSLPGGGGGGGGGGRSVYILCRLLHVLPWAIRSPLNETKTWAASGLSSSFDDREYVRMFECERESNPRGL